MKSRQQHPTEIWIQDTPRQVIVEFFFWPAEPESRHEPGSPEEIEITAVLDQDSAEDYLPVLQHKDLMRIEAELWELRNKVNL